MESDNRKTWRVNLFGNREWDMEGGRGFFIGSNLTLQPSGRLQIEIGTTATRAHDIAQWIENYDATGDGQDDNIYGTLDRHIVDVTLRSTYAINRDLTLQVFLQPFVAVGVYTNIRRLRGHVHSSSSRRLRARILISATGRCAETSSCAGNMFAAARSMSRGTWRRRTRRGLVSSASGAILRMHSVRLAPTPCWSKSVIGFRDERRNSDSDQLSAISFQLSAFSYRRGAPTAAECGATSRGG